jgi:DNA-binding NarL/FixJ family response regulator
VSDLPRAVIVDDDDDQRYLVRMMLERSGKFEVAGEAADGRAAVDLVRRIRPDLVILDLTMPVMGGLEAIPHLHAAAPGVRVVVLTNVPREQAATAAISAGVTAYIEKSIPPKRLVDELIMASGVLDVVAGSLERLATQLPADPRSARSARGFVTQALARWDCTELLDTVELLTSEIVTNAIVHAGSEIDVGVILLGNRLRVEVRDRSPEAPVRRSAHTDATSGRGLELVSQLSDAWGSSHGADGRKTVWFEVERAAAS